MDANNVVCMTNVIYEAAEPYEFVGDGFIFGNEKISLISLNIETVWLRKWTTPLMPDEVKTVLNIPIPKDPNADPNAG